MHGCIQVRLCIVYLIELMGHSLYVGVLLAWSLKFKWLPHFCGSEKTRGKRVAALAYLDLFVDVELHQGELPSELHVVYVL